MTTSQFYQIIEARGRKSAIWGLGDTAATYFALSAVSIARTAPWD